MAVGPCSGCRPEGANNNCHGLYPWGPTSDATDMSLGHHAMILAGDVGGTKTRIALFTSRRGRLLPIAQRRVASRDYPGFSALLKDFLDAHRANVSAACFGVAGTVIDGRSEGVNLPWVIDARILKRMFRFKTVQLINDLSATAYGIEALPPSAFATLQHGQPRRHGTIAVIAAGTGLGEAALVWNGERYRAVASEGGHTDFAPRTDREIELLRYLRKQFGHVSYERILSGPGKLELYRFVRKTRGDREPLWLTRALAVGDPSAVVSEMALTKRSPLCVEALELFVSIYGAEAGNLALKYLACGGLYVGGGIAPTILPLLRRVSFLESFLDKGRFAPLLARIPVRVILDDKAALYGAAHHAMHGAG